MRVKQRDGTEDARENAKRILAGIIHLASGRFDGKTRLYKAFYLAHVLYWQDSQGVLTKHPLVKMTHGPGVHRGDDLLMEMARAGWIAIERGRRGKHEEARYCIQPGFEPRLSESERAAIVNALQLIAGRTGKSLSDLTHRHSRSWKRAAMGEQLDIYIDAIEESYHQRLQRGAREAESFLKHVL